MEFKIKDRYTFKDVVLITELLRSKNGCMWDREQTHQSIRRNFIEEVYEVCETIDENNVEHMKEELGDVLLQVVFHSQIENEKSNFTIDDVCDTICKKLVYRHPHVFSNITVNDTYQILNNWDELKTKEKNYKTVSETMRAVAKSLPALIRAQKVCSKATKAELDVYAARDITGEIKTDADELYVCADEEDVVTNEKIGKMLFKICALSNIFSIDPEGALCDAINKFILEIKIAEEKNDENR